MSTSPQLADDQTPVVRVVNVPYRNGVDVTSVADEALLALAIPDVPELGLGVTCPRDECVLVFSQCHAHAVPHMVQE